MKVSHEKNKYKLCVKKYTGAERLFCIDTAAMMIKSVDNSINLSYTPISIYLILTS